MKVLGKGLLLGMSLVMAIGFSGCVSQEEYNDMKLRNQTQQERIAELESELSTARLELSRCRDRLEVAESLGSADSDSLREEIAALEKAIEQKNDLIKRMQAQLLKSGAPLPMEVSVVLQEFASEHSGMVTYDEETGMLKFKSDLLFAPGSAEVQSGAVSALESLADIMTSGRAKDFDLIIAGHTDNVPIGKPSTRAKHPTNWHLSAHRAIGVLRILTNKGVDPTRVSARAFGQYKPEVPNKPNNGGNAQNRRVEIFVVPKGM